MSDRNIEQRLTELGINSAYYYRLETKSLSKLLNVDEKLLCVLTGVYDGMRRMLAITDSRVFIITAGVAIQGQVVVIKRKAVKSYKFNRRFLISSAEFDTADAHYEFRQTQAAREKLFNYAFGSAIKEYEE